ncbi:diphthine--ammonia ligase isoform X2 [Jatropha curcas]|uniref:diphthine--ammonia ligase isoform X2 n=1 Tax=Jatropha curcas TaxID=180498 RepID=UPI0005FB8C97|nr:diphthine--ammonia ligase isoform X2 [Jatropha curcas]XP_012089349.1 diphthine--ammonia ligase isoform X2 [Jatropha curcas]
MHGSAIVPKENTRIHKASSCHWDEKLNYRTTPGDEVEDMFILLSEVKRQMPSITAVSSGAIASHYQRLRVESVCSRLGLVSLAYLWKQDQSMLLKEMITNRIVAIIVKVAALGLDPAKHLGKEVASLESHLHKLKELYGINVCGEGGEYETLTLDCPLFVNARIVLDEFEIVLHSSDSIAPVGVVHPISFHLENKEKAALSSGNNKTNLSLQEKAGSVFDVQGDCSKRSEATCQSTSEIADSVEIEHDRLHISKTKKDNIISISCWLKDSCKAALQDDLKIVLKHIESQLATYDFGWEHVLYIHLYIADMNEFSTANEIYVKFITQEKCPFGVPSRSTIELPLLQVGLGRAYVEVLVANEQSKNVLHVQSISSWAPSCIGPYSQATLHEEVLYMAGQLGLNPPTMTLCGGGPAAELEQALENSEAVAKSFGCSICTSTIVFTIYCSRRIPLSERLEIQDKRESFLKRMTMLEQDKGNMQKVLDPIVLYVLVPDLPKRAFVEVKPLLFVSKDTDVADVADVTGHNLSSTTLLNCWDFQRADWHNSCIQKWVVSGKICAVVLSITTEIVAKICSESLGAYKNDGNQQNSLPKVHMERVSRFCIYLLDKVILENDFLWEDTMTLRFYFPTSLDMTLETLSLMFTSAFKELSEMGRWDQTGKEPIFNIVPVLGAGRSSESMDDVITCELLAQKS